MQPLGMQTIDRLVDMCPLMKFEGGLQTLNAHKWLKTIALAKIVSNLAITIILCQWWCWEGYPAKITHASRKV